MNKIKIYSFIMLNIISSSLLFSCNMEPFNGISTTFGPMYDFTKRIVKDKLDVITIVGENEPHGFEPNDPQIAAKTERAKLLVAYGQGIDDYAKNMTSKDKYFCATTNVEFFNTKDSDGVETKVKDPHAWLSIKDSKIILKSIADKVVEIDPDNKSYYEENLKEALDEFNALDDEYTNALANDKITTNIFVTSHEAFAYLARDYGLIQYGIADIADNEPNSSQISKIVDYIMTNSIHYICLEELDEPGHVTTVINEIHKINSTYKIDAVQLNAFEGVSINNWSSTDNYISIMKNNLDQLKKALGYKL